MMRRYRLTENPLISGLLANPVVAGTSSDGMVCLCDQDDDVGVQKGLSWIMTKTQQPSRPWFAQR